jgi:hypothetical protein
VIALLERQHVDLAVQVLAQAHVGSDHVERADVALGVRLAHARRRLLPILALVRRVGDQRRRLEVDAARLAVDAGGADVDAARIGWGILDLEEGVAPHRVLDFLGEIERGELQQSNRVLQPRRDGVLLTLAGLQGLENHGRGCSRRESRERCASPRSARQRALGATPVPKVSELHFSSVGALVRVRATGPRDRSSGSLAVTFAGPRGRACERRAAARRTPG